MIKTKRKLLELAIKHYSLNYDTEVYNMIEKQRAKDLLNVTTGDYYTHLPKKPIGNNNYIQIVGTGSNDLVLISTGEIGVFFNTLEIKNCIRSMKIKEIFENLK